MTSARDRRVTLALKWHYLDNLSVEEIQDRFKREDIGSYARSTIRQYLNEKPEEEVIEQIENEQANVRLQIAEREERMYERARETETEATRDETIQRVVPQTRYCKSNRGAFEMSSWEFVEPGDPDWPNWAEEDDVIIRFTGETRIIEPGDEYPVQSFDGSPKYTTEMVGPERDQPDLQGQAMARKEQSRHLEAKGEALGVYQTDINMNLDGQLETTVSIDEGTREVVREALAEEYGVDE